MLVGLVDTIDEISCPLFHVALSLMKIVENTGSLIGDITDTLVPSLELGPIIILIMPDAVV